MTEFTMTRTIAEGFAETLEATRAALGEVGFGIISEIDLSGNLHEKVGADLSPCTILGACQPDLAHQAVTADPSVAALLPCNVVVRADSPSVTVVEAFDPMTITQMRGSAEALRAVAHDARERVARALEILADR